MPLRRFRFKLVACQSGTRTNAAFLKTYRHQFRQCTNVQTTLPARSNAKFAATGTTAQSIIMAKIPRIMIFAFTWNDSGYSFTPLTKMSPLSVNVQSQVGQITYASLCSKACMKQTRELVVNSVVTVSSITQLSWRALSSKAREYYATSTESAC